MHEPGAPKTRGATGGEAELWNVLDREAAQWCAMERQGNEERWKSWEVRLFNEIVKLLPPKLLDGLGLFWEREWPKFDADRGPLSGFVKTRLAQCVKDLGREDRNEGRVRVTDPATGEKKTVWRARAGSIHVPVGDGDRPGELGDAIPDPRSLQAQEDLFAGMLLLAAAVQVHRRLPDLPGKQPRYFPLFLTGDVADQVQRGALPGADPHDEMELFSSLRLPFLDFFMLRACRTLKDLAHTPLKPYGDLVEGRQAETPLPLPNDVYIAYLSREEHDTVSSPAISRQHEAYRTFVRELGIF